MIKCFLEPAGSAARAFAFIPARMATTLALALLGTALLLSGCSSGSGDSDHNAPPPSGADGLWRVIFRNSVVRNDPGLAPLPVGSLFNIVDTNLVWISTTNPGLIWYADRLSIETELGRALEAYVNAFGSPPVTLDYGWNDLGIGDALRETLAVTSFGAGRMSLDHDYDYQANANALPIYMRTGYLLEYVGPAASTSLPIESGEVISLITNPGRVLLDDEAVVETRSR